MKKVMILEELTPNPNAIRIISNLDFKASGDIYIKRKDISKIDVELIEELFKIDTLEEIYLFQNFITIVKNPNEKWEPLLNKVKEKIKDLLPFHDPYFEIKEEKEFTKFDKATEENILKIEAILNNHIRPALQQDGGDLEIMNLEDDILEIAYKGACSSCPASIGGTLKAIENILKEKYNEKIQVKNISNNSNLFY
jgi:Fe-S cluster biogenesis protein NfuA